MLPSLSNLACQDIDTTRRRWREAVGDIGVEFRAWSSWSSSDKMEFVHKLAQNAQLPLEEFVSVYDQVDIDELLSTNRYSVEHVLPRSKCPEAQGNVLNMTFATRSANSSRSNLPLVLWPDRGIATNKSKIRTFDGIRHFVPPVEQRARLARKWLCVRATHSCQVPSAMQQKMLPEIIALAKHDPPSSLEFRVATALKAATGLSNPLILDANPERWYGCPAWRALVRG